MTPIKELLQRARTDPASLTSEELKLVRAELQQIAGKKTGQTYDQKKAKARERSQKQSRAGADIGPPPEVADPQRRAAAYASLQVWCETYFPSRFTLRWSPDHLQVLSRMQEAVCHGGLFALAMPRGHGKTTVVEAAFLWASMTGRHPFVMLLAVSATRAAELLESVKTELLTNDLLAADWPEITHPIRALEGRANRAKGQHIAGKATFIGWHKNEVVFPVVEESAASGVILRVSGLTGGGVRGQKFTRPHDGKNVRPSLVLLDDPQDDQSAASPYQCDQRHRLIHGAVLGMAGPGKKITAVMPCTIIQPQDLSHQLLDREKSPLWTGQRYQLLARFPERMDLWDEYATRRGDEFRNGGDGHLATAWYGQHKAEMDAGALASWPERHDPDELSALQHAMNKFYLDKASFMAEYQNDPMPEMLGDGEQLRAVDLVKRVNGVPRGIVPLSASKITAFIDIQKKVLFYAVCAWSEGFSGAVIDYGSYPDQMRPYYTLGDIQRTLARATPGAGLEGTILAGLEKLTDSLLGREWKREDGTLLRVDRLLIDAAWAESSDTVYDFCRRTPHAATVMASHGRGIGAANIAWSDYVKKPGEQLGFHWLITSSVGKRATRHALLDSNFWKSFLAERLRAAVGDKASLSFFGKKGEADHRLLADHLTSEYSVRTEGRGRQLDEWRLRPAHPDNHFLDCVYGCCAAASMVGISIGPPAPPRRRAAGQSTSRVDADRKRAEFEARRGY